MGKTKVQKWLEETVMYCHGHQRESEEGWHYQHCVVARLGHISCLGRSPQKDTKFVTGKNEAVFLKLIHL